jgi:tRNA threonylcarbamoyladenosine biosynthesis protein TsaE
MNFPFIKNIENENETVELANQLASILKSGDVVALNGDLGTGKTFLVKAVCKYFGVENSSSPSFSIVNEYSGQHKIYHFDFYRIKKTVELYDIGIDEYFSDTGSITFIEWAELYPEVLPAKYYLISISNISGSKRVIEITKHE